MKNKTLARKDATAAPAITAAPAENTAENGAAMPETGSVMHVVKGDEPGADQEQTTSPEQPAAEQPAAEQPSPEPAPAAPVQQPAAPMPLADVMDKVNKIKAASDRLNSLRGTADTLSAFQIGTSGFQDTLTLRDGAGNEWRTHRTPAIQLVLDALRGELRNATDTTEAELRALLAA